MIGFWWFMFVFNIWIPLLMIGFGKYFSRNAPGEINHWFGYRTARSMKNRDTWEFAHHYFGFLWLRTGRVLLVVSVAAMLPVYGKSIELVGTYGGGLCVIQMIVMLVPIFFTESALKREFGK